MELGRLKELLKFPCPFTFKVIGLTREGFRTDIENIAKKATDKKYTIIVEKSKTQKYESFSVNFTLEKLEQVEFLYENFGAIEGVKVVL
ncbi:MAG: DUF493 family protein [Psittacicella sp.]